jgi:hypothetical protein
VDALPISAVFSRRTAIGGEDAQVAALAVTTDEEYSRVGPLLDLHFLSFASTRRRL